jgi:hypothetical protein
VEEGESEMKKWLAWCGKDIQLRVEQSSDEHGELWRGRVIRRPTVISVVGQSITIYHLDSFHSRTEEGTKHGAIATIHNCHPSDAHNLGTWEDFSQRSEEDWRADEVDWLPKPGEVSLNLR